MQNPIFAKAATLRQMISDLGLQVGPLMTSTNRNGDHSAYFDCDGGDRIRVSDHDTSAADSYKWLGGTSEEEVRSFVRARAANIARRRELAVSAAIGAAHEAAARKAAVAIQQDAAAANNAALAAAGYDLAAMTKNQRRDAIKRLRKAGAAA